MRVTVQVEKFRADKAKYNKSYCKYIQRSWEDFLMHCIKKIQTAKREGTRERYAKWRDMATDNLEKLQEVMSGL